MFVSTSHPVLCTPQDGGEGAADDPLGLALQSHRVHPSVAVSTMEHPLQKSRGRVISLYNVE